MFLETVRQPERFVAALDRAADRGKPVVVLKIGRSEHALAGRRIAVVTNSGGHIELILDLAASVGLELPPLAPATRAEAARVIGAIAGNGNPLDAWGNGDLQTNVPHALRTLGADPALDAVVWRTDSADASPLGTPERFMTYARLLVEAAQASARPFYLMGTRPGIFRRDQHELLGPRASR
jgi:acetate---CoA ligase (ADP-forming)